MRTAVTAALLVVAISFSCGAASRARAEEQADTDFAKRVFAGNADTTKSYACFIRRYDAAHLAQHPLQQVDAMTLLISAERIADDKFLDYSFRLGVRFRHRPGDFESSGNCGYAPTVKVQDTDDPTHPIAMQPQGIDFSCSIDCDGGGITVNLANNDGSIVVKPLEGLRLWKGRDPDEAATSAFENSADDKVFRLDRTALDECIPLANDRNEAAALRRRDAGASAAKRPH